MIMWYGKKCSESTFSFDMSFNPSRQNKEWGTTEAGMIDVKIKLKAVLKEGDSSASHKDRSILG